MCLNISYFSFRKEYINCGYSKWTSGQQLHLMVRESIYIYGRAKWCSALHYNNPKELLH